MPNTYPQSAIDGIAIIGMGCRFPGASDIDAYWKLIDEGREGIRDFSEEELRAGGVSPEEYQRATYVRRGVDADGMLDIEPCVFGLSPAKAELLNPQFRVFLRTVFETLEDAGYPGEPEGSRVGVYAGSGAPIYLYPHIGLPIGERLSVGIANASDYLASRVSYTFGFSGPSNTIQTACSTSLVAVNEACEAIWAGRCEMAVAGGVSYSWMPGRGYDYEHGLMYSSEGRCRVFDAEAGGTIFTSGAGAVLLKPLAAARRDGDQIHAVIRGGAVNNDGSRRRSYASPSPEGQAEVIRLAMRRAGVTANDITLVEAHGTGTQKGDPIELEGLTIAWRETTTRRGDCPIGSVKSNIGHADAAAGIAGLIKVVLALKHRTIPATLNVETPNPRLRLEDSPFRLAIGKESWKTANDKPRLAAVSAFGLGGTNAHTIVEEAPADLPEPAESTGWQLLPFSARSHEGLEGLLGKWPTFLERNPELSLADAAFTLQRGRREWKVRDFRAARSAEELSAAWREPPNREFVGQVRERRPVFLFPGQGAQYAGMARGMWENDAAFRRAFEECARHLDRHLDRKLEAIVFPEPDSAERDLIHQTEYAQPALFVVCWALAKRWQAWGIEPAAVLGHSIGEYVAAALAGVFSLEDALAIVARRGRLMGEANGSGGMTAVFAEEKRVVKLLEAHAEIDLAVVNSPSQTVVAGALAALDEWEADLERNAIRFRRLKTSAAFHSRAMESVLPVFERAFDGIAMREPELPVLSNLTEDWLTAEEAVSPAYFARHLRSTVRFEKNLRTLSAWAAEDDGSPLLLLEIGPGNTLTALAGEVLGDSEHVTLSTLPGAREAASDEEQMSLRALGESWVSGYPIDWEKILPASGRRRLSLPGCHFVEQTCLATAAFPTETSNQRRPHHPESPKPINGWRRKWRDLFPPKQSDTDDLSEETTSEDALSTMVSLWRAELKDATLGPDDHYFDRGGDSVTAVRLLATIQRKFGQSLPLSALLGSPTPRSVAAALGLIDDEIPNDRLDGAPSFVVPLVLRNPERGAPVFCFHAIDGSVMFYRELAERVGNDRSVFAVESPLFHGDDDALVGDLESLARRYYEAIREFQPEGPKVFCGYSFGALLAYETARIAIEEGDEIESVIILDMFNPGTIRQVGNIDRLRNHWLTTADLSMTGRVASLSRRVVHLAGWMFRHIGVFLGERLFWRDELRKKRTLAHRSFESLVRTYRPRPVTFRALLVVTEHPWDKFEYPDEIRGWRGWLNGELAFRYIGGTHLEIFDPPYLNQLAECVGSYLAESPAPKTPASHRRGKTATV
ncbi:MAG: alpha/beta fold hydrolase [Verrucomicrobiae bacterium]|nr:alpha/beta fold hydrolase [Verrucomicrobiae bacterium]